MIVTCETCGLRYDDESRWTICPHNSLSVAHNTPYCRRHDLYNCPLCKPALEEMPPVAEVAEEIRDLLDDPRCDGYDGLTVSYGPHKRSIQ